ncbi:MAG: methyltransferase [Candidatus Pacebacteria bacterium]|nr:methyltransferase [Candidatus Paceibacterota bacterium]
MNSHIVKIESLAPSGHGIAENGWYILGAFPEDTVRAKRYKEAEEIIYAELIEIIEPSPNRTYSPTKSPFFDPNAPWQYLDIDAEDRFKKNIIRNIFKKYNININSEIASQTRNDNSLLTEGYRNKAAYAFTYDSDNKLSFALFTRGISQPGKISQSENILVHPVINKIGKQFLEFFNQKKVPLETLKYLTLRYSYYTNTVVAQILVTESSRKKLPWKKSDLKTFIHQHSEIQGIIVSQSEPQVRSANIIKDFYTLGDIEITEEILGKKYTYHPSQFFQIYPDAFAQILTDCENLITSIPNHHQYELLDFFAGIGIIGLHISDLVQSIHGVEQSALASKYALINAQQNNIEISDQAGDASDFQFTEANVDEALEYIKSDQILIVDPARSGLTKKSLEKIVQVQPEYIIYISCNPETQARDYKVLHDVYDIKWSRAYNLFPKTPHIEHVLFLKRKN